MVGFTSVFIVSAILHACQVVTYVASAVLVDQW